MVVETTGIEALPNEILMGVLSSFRTRDLLPMALTSRRVYDLIARILEIRLHHAASFSSHTLILEVFHPSTKLSTPYLLCKYLGTGSMHAKAPDTPTQDIGRLGQMSRLYSHFRPLQPTEDRLSRTITHPAGGSVTLPNALASVSSTPANTAYVSQNIHLESHELFSQLCTITNLVKVGPKRGLFLSCLNIGEGITRIWRDWLAERVFCNGDGKFEEAGDEYERRLLWADIEEHIGLRMRVLEKKDGMPILRRTDEDPAVSYTLQYEELVIRTTQLLLMVEQSLEQERDQSGKAVVIGQWDH